MQVNVSVSAIMTLQFTFTSFILKYSIHCLTVIYCHEFNNIEPSGQTSKTNFFPLPEYRKH